MGQIVAFARNEQGNFVLEVKPSMIRNSRVKTVQVAGTSWYEPLPGLYDKDPDGNDVPLMANVSIRYPSNYHSGLFVVPARRDNSIPSVPFK